MDFVWDKVLTFGPWVAFLYFFLAQDRLNQRIHERMDSKHREHAEALLGADPGRDNISGYYWHRIFYMFGLKPFADKKLNKLVIKFWLVTLLTIISFYAAVIGVYR